MAQEIGAIYDKSVKNIDLSHSNINENINDSFKIHIDTENCYLFLAKKINNVTIKESPDFIKNRLIASGIRPINNVVDISNYVMLECGQPLHFYDSDRLNGMLEVRQAKNQEKLITLDNVERILDENDIVISDGEKAIGLAGVMGGLDTEVENTTKNVIIESAIFNSVKVRKTSKKILRSEASNRFEKGLDPNRTYMAIERACNLLEKYADAKIVSGLCIYDTTEKDARTVELNYNAVNDLLGTNISKNEILDVFRRLGFEYNAKEEKVEVLVPRRRLDISIPEDLIEEVSRIYGVDNIEGKLPILPMKRGSNDKTLRSIRDKMVNLGLNETLTYVLVNENEAKRFTNDSFEIIKLLEPMTEERNTLRYSLISSLYKTYEYNKAHYNKDVSIFEIGKGFWKKNDEYGEDNKLAVLMTGNYSIGIGNTKQVDFYVIKGVAEEILDYLGYGGRYSFVLPKENINEFHPGQTAEISVNNDVVGVIGKLHPEFTKDSIFVFEINLDKLLQKKTGKMTFKEISKYPTSSKDLAIVVGKDIFAKDIELEIKKAAGKLFVSSHIFDIYEGPTIGLNKKSLAFSIVFGLPDRTLTDEEINNTMQNIIDRVSKKFNAELRK